MTNPSDHDTMPAQSREPGLVDLETGNRQARYEALHGIGRRFPDIDLLMDDLDRPAG